MTSTPIVKIVSPRDGFERGVSSLVDCVVRKIIFSNSHSTNMSSKFSSGNFQKKVRSLINITKLTSLGLDSSNKITPENQDNFEEDEEIDVFISGRGTK